MQRVVPLLSLSKRRVRRRWRRRRVRQRCDQCQRSHKRCDECCAKRAAHRRHRWCSICREELGDTDAVTITHRAALWRFKSGTGGAVHRDVNAACAFRLIFACLLVHKKRPTAYTLANKKE